MLGGEGGQAWDIKQINKLIKKIKMCVCGQLLGASFLLPPCEAGSLLLFLLHCIP